MATAKCKVINRWDWSIESATIGIQSPSGNTLWIEKTKFGNFNETTAQRDIVFKCLSLQEERSIVEEIRLTADEMILLKQVSDLHKGSQIDAHLFPKHKPNPIPQATAVPKGPFIPAVQKYQPYQPTSGPVSQPTVQKHFKQTHVRSGQYVVLDSTTLNHPTASVVPAAPVPFPPVHRGQIVPRHKVSTPVAKKGPKPPVPDCIKAGTCTCNTQLKMRDHGTWVGYHCTTCKTGGSFSKPKP